LHEGGTKVWEYRLKNREVNDILPKFVKHNFYLNEMLGASLRLTPAGPRKSASKIAPGDFVRKNLAANLERSSLMYSYGYASADDCPTLFAIFPLNFVPSMQYTG